MSDKASFMSAQEREYYPTQIPDANVRRQLFDVKVVTIVVIHLLIKMNLCMRDEIIEPI